MPWRARRAGGARSAAVIASGAFAVHQLRYLLAFGAGGSISRLGDGLVAHLPPILLGLLVAATTARLARGSEALVGRGAQGRGRRAAGYALGIVAVFCCQELLEGMLIAGHAAGLAGIFAAGGWAALPMAVVFGLLAVAVDRGMKVIRSRFTAASRTTGVRSLRARLPEAAPLPCGLSPLASGLAGRAPPKFS